MSEPSEQAKELWKNIFSKYRPKELGMLLLDDALRAERNRTREECAAKADMVAALWECRQDHASADRCATADAISRDIRATIEKE